LKKENLLLQRFLKSFLFFFIFGVSVLSAKTYKSFDFGLNLFEHKEYFRAISEFQRFIFFNPKNRLEQDAKFYIGVSYFQAYRYYDAIESFEPLIKSKKYKIPAYFFMGDSAFYVQQYDRAYQYYHKIYENADSIMIQQKALFKTTWPLLFQHKFSDVLSVYDKIDVNRNLDLPNMREVVGDLKDFKGLSPWLAGTMSAVIPGAGQFYDKRPGDGFVAFLTVGLLTAGSYFLWNDYNYKEIAVAVSITDIFFYLGNVYSAFSSAHKYNRLYLKKNIDMLKNNYWTEYEYK